MRVHTFAIMVLLALGGLAGVASADKADALFRKGKKLLADKQYAEACAAFEQVDELDPGIGAKVNAAKCFEEWGKLGTAYRWYRDAEQMAERTKDNRLARIRELIEELDINVPRLTLKVPDGADPDVVATITIDGVAFPAGDLNEEQRIDPGPHRVEWIVAGEKRGKMAPVARGGSAEISLDIPKGKGTKKKKPRRGAVVAGGGDGGAEPEEPGVERPGRTHRIAGVSLIAGGVVAVGVAGVLTVRARGRYRDALDEHCMAMTTMCDDEGLSITRDARSTANIATVVTIAGGAMVIGGIVLYVLAPEAATDERSAYYLTPVVGGDGGGLVFGGRY